jgi:hypothetical protein
MAKRSLDLDLETDIFRDLIKLSEEETDFSKISSEGDEETVL